MISSEKIQVTEEDLKVIMSIYRIIKSRGDMLSRVAHSDKVLKRILMSGVVYALLASMDTAFSEVVEE